MSSTSRNSKSRTFVNFTSWNNLVPKASSKVTSDMAIFCGAGCSLWWLFRSISHWVRARWPISPINELVTDFRLAPSSKKSSITLRIVETSKEVAVLGVCSCLFIAVASESQAASDSSEKMIRIHHYNRRELRKTGVYLDLFFPAMSRPVQSVWRQH